MSNHKLTFGKSLLLNRLVSINEVERGLNCNCVCPFEDCNEPLEACKGEIREPYFRHKSRKNCAGAFESQLHLLCKEIIMDNKAVYIPEYKNGHICFVPNLIKFDSIKSETISDGKRPDLVGVFTDSTGNKQELWIEIRCTHQIDEPKNRLIKENNINCLEIDVRLFLKEKIVNKETLSEFLLKMENHREWINCYYRKSDCDRISRIINDIIASNVKMEDIIKQYSDNENLRYELGTILFSLYQTKPNRYDFFLDKETLKYLYSIISDNIGRIDSLSKKGKQRFVSIVQLLYFELIRWDKYENKHYREKTDAYKDCSRKRDEIEKNLLQYASNALDWCRELLPIRK